MQKLVLRWAPMVAILARLLVLAPAATTTPADRPYKPTGSATDGTMNDTTGADPVYDAINVWPMPTTVSLCGAAADTACAGPHLLASPNVTVTVGAGCGGASAATQAQLQALANEAVTAGTSFKPSPRTYNEAPYAAADAFCSKRCTQDSDCGAGSCYVPSERRWSTADACGPSAAYSAGCGCCTLAATLPAIPTIAVVCRTGVDRPADGNNEEGYTLEVTVAGVTITAATASGVAHGVATLAQLLRYDTDLKAHVLDWVPLKIEDAPRYSWRGYMLDTSRHFIPVPEILQLLDGMYAAKLNIFHWHIVDSPSFPMDSASHPELAQQGSWSRSASTIYSAADLAAVVKRATDRFVHVVFEIDTPAHTLAIGKAHPEMMTDCWEWMASARYKTDVDSDDCMALDPTNSAARQMVAVLLGEVAALEGASPFVHVGGDEVKFPCWNASATVAKHVAATYGDLSTESFARLQAEWTANVSCAAVAAAGKRPVLWQPTTMGPGDPAWDGALPRDAVYMIWLNAESAKSYATNGSDVVYTTPFYVAGMGGSGWTHVYNAQIMPDGLTPAQQAHVLGGEVCMWGETMGAGNVFERGFQIGAAAAENFWREVSPTPGPGSAAGLGTATRYNAFLCHLQRYGLAVPPVMPSDCEVAV